jgi:hypothetical protein
MKRQFLNATRLLALCAICTTASAAETFQSTTEIPEGILIPDETGLYD